MPYHRAWELVWPRFFTSMFFGDPGPGVTTESVGILSDFFTSSLVANVKLLKTNLKLATND